MPAALKNNNKERDLLLEALIAPSLLMGIISCQNMVSKSTLLLMPTLDILLVTILVF
jgi:hypothetical protein